MHVELCGSGGGRVEVGVVVEVVEASHLGSILESDGESEVGSCCESWINDAGSVRERPSLQFSVA